MIGAMIGYRSKRVAIEKVTASALFISSAVIFVHLAYFLPLGLYQVSGYGLFALMLGGASIYSLLLFRNRFLRIDKGTKAKIIFCIVFSAFLAGLL